MKILELLHIVEESEKSGHVNAEEILQDVPFEDMNKTKSDEQSLKESKSLLASKNGLQHVVTAEPVLCLFQFAVGLMIPALNSLTYDRVCRMTFNDSYICSNLKNASLKEYEDIVQTKASHWYITQHIAFEGPALLLCFFYGSLGDHFSRRLTLALPCVGELLAAVIFTIIAYHKHLHVGWISFGLAILGLFGGWVTMNLAAFSLISEMSTTQNRTFRISVAEGIDALSIAIAFFTSGIILEHTSYEFIFLLGSILLVFAIVYCYTWLAEPPRYTHLDKSACDRMRKVLEPSKIKDAMTTVFKERENRGRKRLLLLLLSMLVGMLSYYAMYSIGFLYLKKSPLGWSQSLYGFYNGYNRMMIAIASLTFIPIFKVMWHIQDTTILLIGLLSSSLSELFFSFCTKTWMVFLVPPIGIFAQAKYTCYRSLMSQLVQPEELGKMFAMIGALQSISGIAGSSLYNTIYPQTLKFWPGFCFSLGMVVSIVPISLTIWLHRDFKEYGPPAVIETATEGYILGKRGTDKAVVATEEIDSLSDEEEEDEIFILQSPYPPSIAY